MTSSTSGPSTSSRTARAEIQPRCRGDAGEMYDELDLRPIDLVDNEASEEAEAEAAEAAAAAEAQRA